MSYSYYVIPRGIRQCGVQLLLRGREIVKTLPSPGELLTSIRPP
jgi:hypothetical protein